MSNGNESDLFIAMHIILSQLLEMEKHLGMITALCSVLKPSCP